MKIIESILFLEKSDKKTNKSKSNNLVDQMHAFNKCRKMNN